MPLRYRTVLPLAAVCLALAVAPAVAAQKVAPTVTSLGNPPAPNATLNAGHCLVGQTGPIAFSVQFIFPPNDEYHTLLVRGPECCDSFFPQQLTTAHAILNWPTLCQLPVNVSILGATGDPACLVPDPNNVLCAPTLYIIDGTGGGAIQHDLPLPGGCCIQGPAFLKIEFLSDGSCGPPGGSGLNSPRLITDNTPDACVSYNYYPSDPTYRDLVTFWGFSGNPLMWADGLFCDCVTPTIPATWGSVKSLYR